MTKRKIARPKPPSPLDPDFPSPAQVALMRKIAERLQEMGIAPEPPQKPRRRRPSAKRSKRNR